MRLFDWLLGRRDRAATRDPAPRSSTASVRAAGTPAFAVIDVETTGLSPQRDRILELAIIRLDESGFVVDEWVSRFDPDGPVGATHIHGITQADVVGQPRFADRAANVVGALSGLAVVAHNAKFDLAFLRNELEAAGWSVPRIASYCTLDASYAYLPDMARRRLADCCWAVGVRLDDAHSALGDARAAAGLLSAYMTAHGGPDQVLLDAVATARGTDWPAVPGRRPLTAGERGARNGGASRPLWTTPPRPSSRPLLQQLTGLSLLEVIDEGAPVGTTAYLELLFDVLEDGDISDAEADALQDVAREYELASSDIETAHEAFLLALAHRAVDDGRVSQDERRELKAITSLLGVAEAKVKIVVDQADGARHTRLSADLGPLPDQWQHGEPLRVGDRVVFTGCDETQRRRLEQRAEAFGVRVVGAVSRLTALLVTDGSFSGGKAAKAQQFGTRQVHPDVFDVLLQHLQPAQTLSQTAAPTPSFAQLPTANPTATPVSGQPSPSAIRAWAAAAGHDVGVRGRLPKDVVAAYAAAHP